LYCKPCELFPLPDIGGCTVLVDFWYNIFIFVMCMCDEI